MTVQATVQALLPARAGDDRPGLKYGDRTWSWREVVSESERYAAALAPLLRPGRPPHVGLLMENTPEMVFALNAAALGGFVPVGLNDTRRGSALAADVRRADCQLVLTDAAHRGALDVPGIPVLEGCPDPGSFSPRPVSEKDAFMLIFTSGTSGPPKAVPVTNRMIVNSGRHLAGRFGIGPDDVCYQSMPMFHSNAVVAGYAVSLCTGAALALAPRFSASGFLPDIRRFGATYLNYVGKPLAYVLRTPRRPDDDRNPLRIAFGNEASDRDIAEFSERFGARVVDGFGSTEGAVLISRGDDTPPGSVGTPWPGVAVYDRATGRECPRATFDAGRVTNLDACVGELVNTTGAGYFAGYYRDPEATAARMAGGMFWSGDLAYRDAAGFVYLAGRTADWLRVDGENLAAGLVEQALLRHPAISQAAVYGVPDPEHPGDQLVAALVLRDALTPAGFKEFLDGQEDLSAKGRPRYVRLCPALPSTATNKVLKRELIDQGTDFDDECWTRADRGTGYTVRERTR